MILRFLPLTLLLAACSRAPDKITTVAEWERGPASTAVAPARSDANVANKRPFPCCSIEEPVGFFPDYSLRVEVSEK